MRFGLDYLGGAKFSDLLVREHPAGWSAGFFANTFGPCWSTVEALLRTGRCPEVRIHAVWEDDHRYIAAKHDPIIMAELRRANGLQATFPGVKVRFSPFCEHNIGKAELEALYIKMGSIAKVDFTNSYWKGARLDNVVSEVHGKASIPTGLFSYSFDGVSAVDSFVDEVKAKYKNATTFYFWVPQFNLRKNTNDKTPRPERKAIPTGKLIDSVIYLHRDGGKINLSSRHIWKSHADQHEVPKPESRALKPVFITPVKAKRIELVADNGQVVYISGPALPFQSGKFRYYFAEYGYLIAEKAIRIQGHPVVAIRADGRVLGRVNPAYRAGTDR